jgi:hypothetical protein
MKLIVIEGNLKSNAGHYLNNCLAIKQAAENRGIETKFIIHRQAEHSVLNELPAIPCITFNQFDMVSKDPLCGALESHMIQSSTTAKDLLPVLDSEIKPGDLVFYPTASFNQLTAFGMLLDGLPKLKLCKVVFNFVIQDFLFQDGIKFNNNSSFYRMAANKIQRKISKQKILLTANGKSMVSAVSFMLNMPVDQYPMQKYYPEQLINKKKSIKQRARPLIGVFGSMHGPGKGLHLMPKLVDLYRELDWLIQEPSSKNTVLWGRDENLIQTNRNVKLIGHGLSALDYYENFNSVDVVLTPYMLRNDKIQTSGIVSEAAASGKVIVSPANSWVQELVDNGSIVGCTYNEWTVEAIAKSIKIVIDDLDALKKKADLISAEWRKNQSAEAYVSKALDFFAIKMES